MMTRFLQWCRHLVGTPTPPPPAPPRNRQPYIQLPCSYCGRVVAHTRSGQAWKHTCVTGRAA